MTTIHLFGKEGGKFTFSNLGNHQIRCEKKRICEIPSMMVTVVDDRKTLTF